MLAVAVIVIVVLAYFYYLGSKSEKNDNNTQNNSYHGNTGNQGNPNTHKQGKNKQPAQANNQQSSSDGKTIIFCGACGQKLRVPVDKRVEIICPKCSNKVIIDLSKKKGSSGNSNDKKKDLVGVKARQSKSNLSKPQMGTNTSSNSTIEETVLREINRMKRKTGYYSDNLLRHKDLVNACDNMVSEYIDQVVNSKTVSEEIKIVSIKRNRFDKVDKYNTCLEDNIAYELYKYDCYICLFDLIHSNRLKVEEMDIELFNEMMLVDSRKRVSSAKALSREYPAFKGLLDRYSKASTEDREYDFIFASLKVSAVSIAMQAVLFGQFEIRGQFIDSVDFFRRKPVNECKAALDMVITNRIAYTLKRYY